MLFSNGFGITITKYVNSLSRSLIGTVLPLVAWLFLISIGEETWETLRFFFYCVITFGVLVFNEVLVFHICKLNSKIKTNLQEKKKDLELEEGKEELEI